MSSGNGSDQPTGFGRSGSEHQRLADARDAKVPWRRWGPYLSERQWGTVREDYSVDGDAWSYFSHDQARSRAYRWGEDGLAGFSDDQQRLCFAVALWNGHDPILKERLFGLTNREGNHGEDVKEYYFYLDATPTSSYLRVSVQVPPGRVSPTTTSSRRTGVAGGADPEYELLDTGVFEDDRYFDVVVEYAKASPEDIGVRITVSNRGPDPASLHVLPTLWFRNTWSWQQDAPRPVLHAVSGRTPTISASHPELGERELICEEADELLFTENETNLERLAGAPNRTPYVKDAIDSYLVHGLRAAVNPDQTGTKVAAHHRVSLAPGESKAIHLWLGEPRRDRPSPADIDALVELRRVEADAFYATRHPVIARRRPVERDAPGPGRHALVAADLPLRRQPVARRARHRPVPDRRLDGVEEPALAAHVERGRHLHAGQVGVPLVRRLGPGLPRRHLVAGRRGVREGPARADAPGGVPAPERPAAGLRVELRRRQSAGPCLGHDLHLPARGGRSRAMVTSTGSNAVFLKLMFNFTWWVNRKDLEGNNLFEGGFLGLDNIGVFDRSAPLPTGGFMEQADGTAWMALFCQNMLEIAAQLALERPAYVPIAAKFVEHFLWIATSMMHAGGDTGMWDEEDGFFYDVLRLPDGRAERLKVRSLVGLLPLCAVTAFDGALVRKYPEMGERMRRFIEGRPELRAFIHDPVKVGEGGRRLAAILDETKLRRVLATMLDEDEFLSPYGIRSLSRYHADHPYVFRRATRSTASPICRPNRTPACSAGTPTGAARSGCPSTP